MVKLILIFFFACISLKANVYEENCVSCHKDIPVSIDKYFYRYLLKYSSEKRIKNEMLNYLQYPSKEKTIMPEAFINRFGIKNSTKLTDDELIEAVNIYWEKYKIFGKLK